MAILIWYPSQAFIVWNPLNDIMHCIGWDMQIASRFEVHFLGKMEIVWSSLNKIMRWWK